MVRDALHGLWGCREQLWSRAAVLQQPASRELVAALVSAGEATLTLTLPLWNGSAQSVAIVHSPFENGACSTHRASSWATHTQPPPCVSLLSAAHHIRAVMDGVLWPLLSRAEESVSGDVAASTPGIRCELVGRVAKEGLPPAAQLELLRRMAAAAVSKGHSVTGAAWGGGGGGGGGGASVGREEVEWTEPVVKLVHTLLGLLKELPQVR